MSSANKTIVSVLILLVIVVGAYYFGKGRVREAVYSPVIEPSSFSKVVNNPYFTLTPGRKMVYEAKTDEGIERIEVIVTNEEKEVMGVDTVVVWDRVWLDGELIEDTKDWYAQDQEGNVWYFGEDTSELKDGVVLNHNGAWEAGVDGAKPGIIMKADPKVGDSYYQEFYAGVAEDRADVVALGESVTTPYGDFKDCLKTYDYTPLDPDSKENKFYCKEVGGLVLEVDTTNDDKAELTKVERSNVDQRTSQSNGRPASSAIKSRITNGDAIAVALLAVPGKITNLTEEKRLGKDVYVVGVLSDRGGEVDVIVDLHTGEMLAIEE